MANTLLAQSTITVPTESATTKELAAHAPTFMSHSLPVSLLGNNAFTQLGISYNQHIFQKDAPISFCWGVTAGVSGILEYKNGYAVEAAVLFGKKESAFEIGGAFSAYNYRGVYTVGTNKELNAMLYGNYTEIHPYIGYRLEKYWGDNEKGAASGLIFKVMFAPFNVLLSKPDTYDYAVLHGGVKSADFAIGLSLGYLLSHKL